MFENASPRIFQNAKELRGNLTVAEMMLWLRLMKGVNSYKFRRQHPIGKFIADFYCHRFKLIIELDGSIHNDPQVETIDREREKDLRAWGYQVIRFNNQQIYTDIDNVILKISQHLI